MKAPLGNPAHISEGNDAISTRPDLLAAVAPELEQGAYLLKGGSSGAFHDRWQMYGTDMRAQRRRRNLLKEGVGAIYLQLAGGIALHMLDQPEQLPEQDEAFVKGLFQPLAGIVHPASTDLPLQTLATMEKLRRLDALSIAVNDRLGSEVSDSTPAQFGLLQLFAESPAGAHDSAPPQSEAARTLQALYTFRELRQEGTGPINSLMQGLIGGRFDRLLAEEMLAKATSDSHSLPNGDQAQLAQWTNISEWLQGDEVIPVIARLASDEGRARWPALYMKMLKSYCFQYGQTLSHNRTTHQEYFAEHINFPVRLPQENIAALITQFAAGLGERVLTSTGASPSAKAGARLHVLSSPRAAQQRRRLASRQRRHGQGQAEASVDTPVEPDFQSESGSKKQRDIVYINPGNEEMPADSSEFKGLIEDYAQRHPEVFTLGDDIRAMLERLSEVDLSKGGIRGIGTVARNVRIGSRNINALLKLDPQCLAGLSTRSTLADRVRILFTPLEANKAGLIAILDKDEVGKFGRSHGIAALRGKR